MRLCLLNAGQMSNKCYHFKKKKRFSHMTTEGGFSKIKIKKPFSSLINITQLRKLTLCLPNVHLLCKKEREKKPSANVLGC